MNQVTLTVFDPPLCCSTGVCGPSVDEALVRFAADLAWLKSQGVAVQRFNLAQEPGAFAADSEAKATLQAKGVEGLPLVKVNGLVKSSGLYPSRAELAAWAGVVSSVTSPKASPGGCCEPAKPLANSQGSSVRSGGCC